MRRKSNFAPSDSEEREDERCAGLHSNDMVEIEACLRMQGCRKCIRLMSTIPHGPPGNVKAAISL